MAENDEIVIDLRDVWKSLIGHVPLIAGCTALFLAAGYAYVRIAPPVYESTAIFKVMQTKGMDGSMLRAAPVIDMGRAMVLISSYTEILKSGEVAGTVLAEARKENPDARYNFSVNNTKNTQTFNLVVQARRPDLAKKANDAITEQFLKRAEELSRSEIQKDRVNIEKQAGVAAENLRKAEQEQSEFQKKNRVWNPDRQVESLQKQLDDVITKREQSQMELTAGKATIAEADRLTKESRKVVESLSKVAEYRKELTDLESQREALAAKRGARHPNVVRLDGRISDQKLKVQEETLRIENRNLTLERELRETRIKSEMAVRKAETNLKDLQKAEKQKNDDIRRLLGLKGEFSRLQRNANSVRDIYNTLAKRLEEARAAEANVPREVVLISSGSQPGAPVSPKKLKVLVAAAFVGFFLSACFVVARDLFFQGEGSGGEGGGNPGRQPGRLAAGLKKLSEKFRGRKAPAAGSEAGA